MISNQRPTRRSALRGLAGVSVALPWLEALAPRGARAATTPTRRLVIVYISSGITPASFWPTATGSNFTLPPVLAPLEPLRSRLTILRGVNMETARATDGNSHNVGMTNLLTARKFRDIEQTEFGAVGWGAGISIDQHIAAQLNAPTRFPSLQLGVQANRQYKGDPYSYLSYAGPARPLPSEDDPRRVFEKVFARPPMAPGADQLFAARRQSILDFVKDDLGRLKPRLGAADQQKLTAHLEGVRELEKRVMTPQGNSPACTSPAPPPTTLSLIGDERHPALSTLMTDLTVASLACDATRVVTLQYSTAQSGLWPKFVGDFPSWHHDLSHRTDNEAVGALVRLQTWYVQQLAALATKLDAIKEGDQSLLDQSAVLLVSEVAVGNNHSFVDMPFVLLGRAGGAFAGGRSLACGGRPHNDLFVTLCQAMGLPDTTFGDPAFNKGPLPGLG